MLLAPFFQQDDMIKSISILMTGEETPKPEMDGEAFEG
jgi:hypothetical protein